MFKSMAQSNKCLTTDIDISGETVKHERCIRNLGAFLVETLYVKEHVKRKCPSAMLIVFRINVLQST